MRIVSRTCGVVDCTLSLHAEGPSFKSLQLVQMELEQGRDSTFGSEYWYWIREDYTFGGAYGFGGGVKFHIWL